MTPLSRSAHARIVPMLCALTLALWPPVSRAAEPGTGWRSATTMPALVRALDSWLDSHSPYAARDAAPDIRLVSHGRIRALSSAGHRSGDRRRGLYDPENRVIYLARPWSMRDARDVSVLLHELTHHRQATARHWYCPGQQELPAYRLQAAWLAEQGTRIAINWIAATLAGGCTTRDIHPD